MRSLILAIAALAVTAGAALADNVAVRGTTSVIKPTSGQPIILPMPEQGSHWACVAVSGTDTEQCTVTEGPVVPPPAPQPIAQLAPPPVVVMANPACYMVPVRVGFVWINEPMCPGDLMIGFDLFGGHHGFHGGHHH